MQMRAVIGLCAALATTLAAMVPAQAAPMSAPEYSVKAAFLYKFAAFVDWPPGAFAAPASPLNLCIVGYDPFGLTLNRAIEGQRIGARPVVARRLTYADPNAGCHIIYIGGSRAQPVADGIAALRGAPVLVISDQDMGSARGAIHFVVQDNRVRFHIDDAAAARNGVSISSKLMQLALSVRLRGEGG